MSTLTNCTTLIVKFFAVRPAEEVRAFEVTGARHLSIQRDENYITVNYIGEIGFPLKQINYSVKDVKEYVCEGVLNNQYLESK